MLGNRPASASTPISKYNACRVNAVSAALQKVYCYGLNSPFLLNTSWKPNSRAQSLVPTGLPRTEANLAAEMVSDVRTMGVMYAQVDTGD